MKKIGMLIAIVIMALGLLACGKSDVVPLVDGNNVIYQTTERAQQLNHPTGINLPVPCDNGCMDEVVNTFKH